MLTREQATELFDKLYDYTTLHTKSLRNIIEEFIEKPKREIQIGDIYKDKEGFYVEIVSNDVADITNHPTTVMSKCGYVYDKQDGRYMGEFDRSDLDISKRYKLVEICEKEQEIYDNINKFYKFKDKNEKTLPEQIDEAYEMMEKKRQC